MSNIFNQIHTILFPNCFIFFEKVHKVVKHKVQGCCTPLTSHYLFVLFLDSNHPTETPSDSSFQKFNTSLKSHHAPKLYCSCKKFLKNAKSRCIRPVSRTYFVYPQKSHKHNAKKNHQCSRQWAPWTPLLKGRRILRFIKFGIDESSLKLSLDMVNL